MSDYVYPGANHTRFHHALGAMHLVTQAIETLRSKDVDISEEEAKAVLIAILLHDIGHGPFSHALEHTLLSIHHEELSYVLMQELNKEFDNQLDLAISIFQNTYSKPFLHQLVSSQLDMDRMDYLNRDSFFTGVSEGVIGYDRIIKMLAVVDDELVIEEKGIYSVEKFLISRRLMYWQVYLHKTVVSAEQMLILAMKRAKMLAMEGMEFNISDSLKYFFYQNVTKNTLIKDRNSLIHNFIALDDTDVFQALKLFSKCSDQTLAFLSKSLVQRKLFKVEFQDNPFSEEYILKIESNLAVLFKIIPNIAVETLIIKGVEHNSAYVNYKNEIKVLLKTRKVLPLSKISQQFLDTKEISKYYLCYPKLLQNLKS